MIKRKNIIIILVAIIILMTISTAVWIVNNKDNRSFKRCMNIGNALESPKDIPWDVEMKVEYFDVIKKAGFDSVRIPVRFSDYAKNNPSYMLDEDFMEKLDGYINYALNDELVVILDFHHFEEIMDEPQKYEECFLSIWSQLGERYKNYPPELIFELLNEPKNNLNGELWNSYIREGVEVIRQTNKNRKIIIGPDNYYSVDRLNDLYVPKDKNIIVSFHYYEPNEFTFQGNQYHPGFEHLKDIKWSGTEEEINYVKLKFNIAKEFGEKNNVSIFLGEFGANTNAQEPWRMLWTEAIRKEAEEDKFSWGYWELCSGFGIYDEENRTWDKEMLDALISPGESASGENSPGENSPEEGP